MQKFDKIISNIMPFPSAKNSLPISWLDKKGCHQFGEESQFFTDLEYQRFSQKLCFNKVGIAY